MRGFRWSYNFLSAKFELSTPKNPCIPIFSPLRKKGKKLKKTGDPPLKGGFGRSKNFLTTKFELSEKNYIFLVIFIFVGKKLKNGQKPLCPPLKLIPNES